jgi:glucose/arabinose dehydrogenase
MQMLTETMHDYVFDIKPGGYYGQPNLTRGRHPQRRQSDRRRRSHEIAEYPSAHVRPQLPLTPSTSARTARDRRDRICNAFNALNNQMLVTRHSGGDDIFILTPSHTGNTVNGISGVNRTG